MTPRSVPASIFLALLWCAIPAWGDEFPELEVIGRRDRTLTESDAASQGRLEAGQLNSTAMLRPAEVLEHIEGMVVTQHSGDGKANQYFLRGMNLDHGTDFATTVNGVPVNMPSHAHGQGYSDLNFLIPELIERVDYRKGPYFAADGDFSSAGSARIVYRQRLQQSLAEVTLGQGGYQHALVADSHALAEGVSLLSAVTLQRNDGPWTTPEALRKRNALLTLSGGSPREGWSTSLSAYSAQWNATDQVPQRLLDAGVYQGRPFGRFDALDPTDGGQTERTSLSAHWHQDSDDAVTRVEAYLMRYTLRLFSNFTYSLDRANDQFAQSDQRTVWGGHAYRAWHLAWGGERSVQNTVGLQLRQDRIHLGLYDTVSRQVQTPVREDDVTQTQLGLYAENEVGWQSWLRTVLALRADHWRAQVLSNLQPANSGAAAAARLSPKFSLILGPWAQTAFFFNAGHGFHSNDARGVMAKVDARTGQPVNAVPALVGSRGLEVGLKSQPMAGLQTRLALWRLDFDSELVYVGDAGNTTAGRASRRIGVEWGNRWVRGDHLRVDANLAWTRPRYVDGAASGAYMANAVQKVVRLNLVLDRLGPWSAGLGWRYLGAAPLTEDNSVRSMPSVTANLWLGHKVSRALDWRLEVLNLTDRKNNDISYDYTSRLAGEPAAGVDGVHLHPAEPRTFRLTVRCSF